MMTLKISVFRIPIFISPSINRNVLCFIQMSSSDDEAPSPETGACSSKDPVPPLQSESADDEDELSVSKRKSGYRRPRVEWREVMRHEKGDGAVMGEDEMKLQSKQASNQIMEESRMVRLPGHVPVQSL